MSQFGLTEFNLRDRFTSVLSQETTYYSVIDEETGEEVVIELDELDRNAENLIIRKEADVNVLSRVDGYNKALTLIGEYLFTGIGLAGYENRVGEGYNSNNIFLAVAVAGGIISLALFVTFLYIILKQSILIYKLNPQFSTIIIGSLGAILITGMFNDNFLMGFVWLILGITAKIPEIIWEESSISEPIK
jgi:hypothetical protein